MTPLTREVFTLAVLMPGLPAYRLPALTGRSTPAVTAAVASLTARTLLRVDSRGGLCPAPWTLL